MATIAVTDAGKQYNRFTPAGSAGNVSGQRNQQNFLDLMNKTAGSGTKPEAGNSQSLSQANKNQISPKDISNKKELAEAARVKTSKETEKNLVETNSQDTAAAEEAVQKKADELVGEVADQLDMPEEEVRRIMELMGIQALDLFDPSAMAKLLVELSGKSDMMSLVMDGELYAGLTRLQRTASDMLQEVAEDLELPPEIMDTIMEKLRVQEEGKADIGQTTTDYESVSNAAEDRSEGEIDITIQRDTADAKPLRKEDQPIQTNRRDAVSGQDSVKDSKTGIPVTVHSDKEQGGTGESADNSNLQNFLQGNARQALEAAAMPEGTQAVFEKADTESIMKQITDYMRIHIGSEVTEMEIQLQPANLGSINLQVTMKNGAITAQFTAQNESVKQALETQIVQLRENLEQQGIKIDAVEVTIASHEFERNLQQGGQSRDSRDAGSDKKNSRRRIVLDEMDMPEDVMPEEDRIQVQMMRQSGNTVSLRA